MCAPKPSNPPRKKILGRYELEQLIGSGECCEIWSAWDGQLSRRVAVKLLRRALEGVERANAHVRREARLMARLRNEHVPQILERGILGDGRTCIVMDLLDGESLENVLAREGTLDPTVAVGFALHICIALAEAHANGIVHRDIKPDNIFITKLPDGSRVAKLIDFGVAWVPGDEHGAVVGTPLYMSPEALCVDVTPDPRADIWALGAVLYEALLGAPAYDAAAVGGVLERLANGSHEPAAEAPTLPDGLGDVIDICLSRDRGERFKSVVALAVALSSFAAKGDRRLVVRVERVADGTRVRDHARRSISKIVRRTRASTRAKKPPVEVKVQPARAPGWKRRLLGSVAAAALFTGVTVGAMALTTAAVGEATREAIARHAPDADLQVEGPVPELRLQPLLFERRVDGESKRTPPNASMAPWPAPRVAAPVEVKNELTKPTRAKRANSADPYAAIEMREAPEDIYADDASR